MSPLGKLRHISKVTDGWRLTVSGALGVNLRPAKHTGGRVGSSIHRDHKAPEIKKKHGSV